MLGMWAFVIPYFAEQHFWGSRVFDLGAEPRPVRRKKLTADALAMGLRSLMEDKMVQQQAQASRVKIRLDNGVQKVLEELETLPLMDCHR